MTLGAFIRGAFEGHQYGEGMKDTKRRREREDKADARADEKHDWNREYHEQNVEKHGWNRDYHEQNIEKHGWARQNQEQNVEKHGWNRDYHEQNVEKHDWARDNHKQNIEKHGWARQNQEQNVEKHGWARDNHEFDQTRQGWAVEDRAYQDEIKQRERDDQAFIDQVIEDAKRAAANEQVQGPVQRSVLPDPASTATRNPHHDTPTQRSVLQNFPPEQADVAPATPQQQARPPARSVAQGAQQQPANTAVAADNFMKHYRETAVPKIKQRYIERGEFEKAQALDSYLASEHGTRMQQGFAKVVASLAMGDFNSAMPIFEEMYETVNDGIDLDMDRSKFEYDQNGNPTAAVFVMTDQRTGETYTRRFEGSGDLAEQMLSIINPEGAFEYLIERQNQAAKVVSDQQSNARGVQDDMAGAVRKEAERIREQGVLSSAPLSEEEIYRQAHENVRRSYQQGAGVSPTPDWRP